MTNSRDAIPTDSHISKAIHAEDSSGWASTLIEQPYIDSFAAISKDENRKTTMDNTYAGITIKRKEEDSLIKLEVKSTVVAA